MEPITLKIADFYKQQDRGLVLVVDTQDVTQSFQIGDSCEIITTLGSIPTKITGIETVSNTQLQQADSAVGVVVEKHVKEEDLKTASFLYVFSY